MPPKSRLLRGLLAIRAANLHDPAAELAAERSRERVNQRRGVVDKGKIIVTDVERLGNGHADKLVSLVKQALSLVEAIDITNSRFDDADLPDIELDARARNMLTRAISKLTEIELFRLSTEALIGDPDLRKQIVDVFIAGKLTHTELPHDSKTTKKLSDSDMLQQALAIALQGS